MSLEFPNHACYPNGVATFDDSELFARARRQRRINLFLASAAIGVVLGIIGSGVVW